MAVCKGCGRDMLDTTACTVARYNDFVDGVERERIRYNDEPHEALRLQFEQQPEIAATWGLSPGASWEDMLAAVRERTTECHDCGVAAGEYHHPGCDMEECPRCGMQAMSCECVTPSEGSRNICAAWGTTRGEAMRRIAGG